MYWLRRKRRPRSASASPACCWPCSRWADASIINGSHTPIEPRGDWLSKLPIFDSVVPTRMSLLVLPIVAVMIALAHDHVLASYGRRVRDAGAAARPSRARLAERRLAAR